MIRIRNWQWNKNFFVVVDFKRFFKEIPFTKRLLDISLLIHILIFLKSTVYHPSISCPVSCSRHCCSVLAKALHPWESKLCAIRYRKVLCVNRMILTSCTIMKKDMLAIHTSLPLEQVDTHWSHPLCRWTTAVKTCCIL